MRLYILRHADAETDAPTDGARRLSKKGEEQARTVGRFCRDNEIRPDVILASPLVRTQQTAKIVAKETGAGLETAPWLACGASPEAILSELSGLKSSRAIMLVGHEPDLGELIAHLIGGGATGTIHVRKACLAFLEVYELHGGGGRLEFFVPVQMM